MATIDINELLKIDSNDSEAYYFKGFLMSKMNSKAEALLSYEQSIKHNNSKRAVTKSIYEIAKIKIEQRDYYGAFYCLERASHLDVEQKFILKFKIFTDGATFLMKRKFQEGIDSLSELIKQNLLNDFLKPLTYTHRAYGYFCLGIHDKCLLDL